MNDDDLTFVLFQINFNLGTNMNGKYFIQTNGNEQQIKKFKRINQNGDVRFHKEIFTWAEMQVLMKAKGLWEYDGTNDNVERLVLKGKIVVPGEDEHYTKDELIEWWYEYLGEPKWPKWTNIIEEVIDLSKN